MTEHAMNERIIQLLELYPDKARQVEGFADLILKEYEARKLVNKTSFTSMVEQSLN